MASRSHTFDTYLLSYFLVLVGCMRMQNVPHPGVITVSKSVSFHDACTWCLHSAGIHYHILQSLHLLPYFLCVVKFAHHNSPLKSSTCRSSSSRSAHSHTTRTFQQIQQCAACGASARNSLVVAQKTNAMTVRTAVEGHVPAQTACRYPHSPATQISQCLERIRTLLHNNKRESRSRRHPLYSHCRQGRDLQSFVQRPQNICLHLLRHPDNTAQQTIPTVLTILCVATKAEWLDLKCDIKAHKAVKIVRLYLGIGLQVG